MRKGYLLTDAMIVVFLTAMIALVTSAALPAAGKTKGTRKIWPSYTTIAKGIYFLIFNFIFLFFIY